MPRELLRSVLRNPDLSDHVWAELVEQGRVAVDGGFVRLSSFRPSVSDEDRRWVEAITLELKNGGPHGRTVDELAKVVPEPSVRDLAEYLVREGSAVRVGRDRFYDSGAARDLREAILEEVRERGRAVPAELRERTGLTRKYLIPFLEWLDGSGYTARDGDGRRLGPLGEGSDKGS
jgi:selenocysteine-specific elongation factor